MISAATVDDIEDTALLMQYCPTKNAKGIKFTANDSNAIIDAMVIFDFWTPNAAQMHVWAREAKYILNPIFIREVFRYAFIFADKRLLVSVTPSDNSASLKLSEAMGFRETFRIKNGWDLGVDMVIKEMRREECRFLQKEVA